MLPEKLKLAARLWEAGIRAEYAFDAEMNLDGQLGVARGKGIPWAVVLNYKTYFSTEDEGHRMVRLRALDKVSGCVGCG